MSFRIDYFFAPVSPWTYLGHARFADLARQEGATIRLMPMDLGRVFPVSGGLPLAKRAPQRQAYRLLELKRFADYLGMPLNPQPKHFPVPADEAARLIIACDQHDGTAAAMRLTGALLAATWVQERDISDPAVLSAVLQENGLPTERLDQSREESVMQRYDENTREAIDTGVFGAPSYVFDGEIFWGQDRLELLAHRLRSNRNHKEKANG
ncbi:2-hydroxychromene-2-carboxylate isomerase [Ramlibacter sp. AW1]|uniref:2-hydroxychromene-2-carboxylate isomerase n=1 Tax=Ramlibacter aurantiacus TaxID=2801330 RepID=A0A936ZR95_9BURK|nr:2-hydroxychromene-2-carboxylate isomerase [Ramlibacter aurantiacus]MBL0421061.1 2-hydroxychromene-2-carboxylate isomerase [Ramlibacter aurantiacus]